ncbi:siderophore-interacting protein [Kineococcus gynurae]|uniref:Siderophore-interacting protein n=1 Tax=Kineococcus gynurae TaxID=452979 RepID=A0ABV5LXA8_9ACTN
MEYDGTFEAVVAEVGHLTPSLLRVVLAGPGVAAYRGLDAGDECLTMRFPDVDPAPGSDGWAWRNYTVRAKDATSLVVDVVLHEGGSASTWARSAQVGDTLVLARPRSWYAPPAGTTARLLVADMTGLPALARIVESLSPAEAAATTIVVELLTARDVDALPHRPGLRIETFVGPGARGGSGSLALRCAPFVPPVEGGYVWFAGEASESRAIRKHLRGDRGYATAQAHCVGYWRRDAEAWLARFAPRAEELLAHYEAALARGEGWEAASEAYDTALERAGL